jgi:hypothetical protein
MLCDTVCILGSEVTLELSWNWYWMLMRQCVEVGTAICGEIATLEVS